ncbi:PTS sugar transporter subunit IIA [Psychromonas sp. RZ22]|uniref:PTS sugar transporter subunit IIA n=1 Tax=Psychromonas algarum TaxID=2555643 RepID=UPI00106775A3|nr:PTS sugar transporter subunit IIA [Psychromonas sp. RZ22]TEW55522.1 PTS sugar transporter subunit IIA [Psychromonas sp. RZ22]
MTENLITIETMMLDLPSDSKADALHKICGHLFLLRKSQDPSALYNDIMKREEMVSTFAGQQIAIPHVITDYISSPTLCFVRINNKDFTWSDNDQSVRIIFLLCVPTEVNLQQLRESQSYIFSSIAQLMGNTKMIDLWLNSNKAEDILDSLKTAFESNLHSTIKY